MIRLRQSFHAGLRHPVFGPVLVLVLAVILAFAVFHTIEHGVEGLLYTCAILAAVVLRLVVVGTVRPARLATVPRAGRAPPRASDRRFIRASRPPTALRVLPLRR